MRRPKHNRESHPQLKGFFFDTETKKYYKLPKTHDPIAWVPAKQKVSITSPKRLSRRKHLILAHLREREVDASVTLNVARRRVSMRSLFSLLRKDSSDSKAFALQRGITAAAPHPCNSTMVVAGQTTAG